jgi:hypothetical protein
MDKHTRGPWEVADWPEVPGTKGSTVEMPEDWVSILCADEKHGDVVAYTHPDNAPILAAAPDLLAALESIASSGLAKDSADARFLCGIARAAIAKARGA